MVKLDYYTVELKLYFTFSFNILGISNEPKKKETKIMDIVGAHLKKFLTKFWIWVVAATLFAVAITGQRMTGFRIVYMALFLIFILSFQVSFVVLARCGNAITLF